eukprot:TRINITY_DN9728_c0_g2_i1.p1 TRINITY_DN9728_c0_g2~~TRINITY_DN9728_c0_g2_i1.p1  ORF type:complete len:382 (+),score=34.19 TRINITY_DN9728_c0_g2_i1:52-1197(+)
MIDLGAFSWRLVSCAWASAVLAIVLQGCGVAPPSPPPPLPKSAYCPGDTTAGEVLAGKSFKGKLALVTGGDSGLGYATAFALAQQGARVIIANHNQTHGQQAANKIGNITGADVQSFELDLGSLVSVRSFVAQFQKTYGSKLHLLVNNAGIGGPSVNSSDGFELVFQVDYLGHFLLTHLLLPALRNGSPSRVINVASGAHENACESAGWPKDCFKDWTYLPPPVVPKKNVTIHYHFGAKNVSSSSYGIAKFLNIQHAAALAMMESSNGIKAFSLTPGFALTSMTKHVDPTSPGAKAFCEGQVHPDASLPANPCPFSADQGAAVIAFCASGPSRSGAYYSRTYACEERPTVQHGFTESMQLELYNRSLAWVGELTAEQVLVV